MKLKIVIKITKFGDLRHGMAWNGNMLSLKLSYFFYALQDVHHAPGCLSICSHKVFDNKENELMAAREPFKVMVQTTNLA